MTKSQESLAKKIKKLPNTAGVYFFMGPKKEILYIGKATSLKNRVQSYLNQDIADKRSPLIAKMVLEAKDLKFQKTDSVLEALLLEAELIKKFTPRYNTALKDQKSFNYIVITNEKFPRVLVMRERELQKLLEPSSQENPREERRRRTEEIFSKKFPWFSRDAAKSSFSAKHFFGPFPHGNELKEALKIVRKIFPFRDRCNPPQQSLKQPGYFSAEKSPPSPASRGPRVALENVATGCFNYQIGLCPGVCVGAISEKEYAKTIRHIKIFFEGNKKKLLKDLEREMKNFAKKRDFENADKTKRQIFALQHIQDVAMIKKDFGNSKLQNPNSKTFRIEAYDIAHISGDNMVGVMTVVENGEINKSAYRKFKIRNQKTVDDTRALQEVLERRFSHPEWQEPDLVVVDGGAAQLNLAKKFLANHSNIQVVAVTKDERHKAREILNIENLKFESDQPDNTTLFENLKRQIILVNSESHRFALAFHRKLRKIG